MINYIIFALWFFLPAGLANAAPVFANRIPYLNQWKTPMDFNKHFKGKRILGNNKTWRGFCFGIFVALLTIALQKYFYANSEWLQANIKILNYSDVSLGLGVLLGAGALIGDAAESFCKRQANVASGEAWFPFDQLDYIVGGLLLSSLVVTLQPIYSFFILFTWFCLHLISSYIGYLFGLKEKPL